MQTYGFRECIANVLLPNLHKIKMAAKNSKCSDHRNDQQDYQRVPKIQCALPSYGPDALKSLGEKAPVDDVVQVDRRNNIVHTKYIA